MKHIKISLTLLIVIGLSIGLRAQKYEAPKIEQYKLNNGLTVILCEDHTQPQIWGQLTVKAGSKDEPADATGLAHYLEHMMFKGTQNMGTVDWEKEKPYYEKVLDLYDQLGKATDKKAREAIQQQINEASIQESAYVIPNEYPKLLSEIGASGINANTSFDRTVYLSFFPSNQVEKWLTFYCNSFQNPVFRSFQAELETVYEEYNMYKDMAGQRVSEEIMQKTFSKSPYGRPIIGWGEHLKTPSLHKLIKFYETYYVPNNIALILCGDFNSESIKPHIEKTFGKWVSKEVPATPIIKEDPFKGRQEVSIKAPFEQVRLVFRTVPENHPDNDALSMCGAMLSNGQTGFIDLLISDGIFTSGTAGANSMKEDGYMLLAASPNPQAFYKGSINPMFISSAADYKTYIREIERSRIIAMEESEKKLLESLQRLADGNFTDQMLEGVKKMTMNSYIVSLESTKSKLDILSDLFVNNENAEELLKTPAKINAITKEEIMRVAKKYFGKDYMAFIIKRGTSKTEKLEKPQIKPLEFKSAGAESLFAKEFRTIKSPAPAIKYVDFKTDAQKYQLKNGNSFYYSKNPVNDIFSLTIRFDVGKGTMKELEYAYLMNYAGGGGFNVQSFKSQMNSFNCSYSINASDSYVTVSLSGPESNFKAAANLISLMINGPVLYQNIVSSVMERESVGRRYEKTEPSIVQDALEAYVLYGNQSSYLDRMTLNAISKIKAEEVTSAFKKACSYSATIFCSGSWIPEQARALFESSVQMAASPIKGNAPFIREKAKITENTVYFVHLSDAKQSQISIFANEKPYQISEDPIIGAFNFYLSGGFNGLMQQEIREKRSLAYHSSANYTRAALPGKDSYLSGNMSTQDDKTNSAIEVFSGLLRNMPQYSERMPSIKEYLTQSLALRTPSFRGMGAYIESNERIGFTEDPLKTLLPAYEKLTFEDILKFYTENVKDRPMAITIVGDKSRVNLKDLEKYGKVVMVDPSKIFSKDEE